MTDSALLETTDVVEESNTYEGSSILTILMIDVDIDVKFCSDIVKFVVYV